jgi:cell division protein FtsW
MKKLSLIIFFDSLLLIFLGLYLVMSASSTYSNTIFANQFYLFNHHLVKAAFGVFLMIIFSFVPYDIYKDYSKQMIIGIVILLVATLFIATAIKGARRFLELGIISFQPSDFAKLILFIHLAALLDKKGELIKDLKLGFRPALFWVLLISGLIFVQPNVSNGIILLLISFIILFIAGARFRHIFSSVSLSTLSAIGAALVFSHSRVRIFSFVKHLLSGNEINAQVRQAILGFGSGGLFGVGFGHSSQRNLFLPEAYGDFIFAILGEETGFIGAVIVLLIYIILFVVGIIIAKNAKDKFGQYLALAISLSFIIYALVNAAVASGLVPTTGLPLPFISYGGTSLTVLCISTGILINIGLSSAKQPNTVIGVQQA